MIARTVMLFAGLLALSAASASAQHIPDGSRLGSPMTQAQKAEAERLLAIFRAKMPVPIKRITYIPRPGISQYGLICDFSRVKNAPKPQVTFTITINDRANGDDMEVVAEQVGKLVAATIQALESGVQIPNDTNFEINAKRRRSL